MTLTTKYNEFIDLAKTLLAENGVAVTYGVHDNELTGQAVNDDNRVEKTYKVNVFLSREVLRRQAGTFMPEDRTGALMEAVPFEPKTGDYMITPAGRRYSVTGVIAEQPDGVPIYYELMLQDG